MKKILLLCMLLNIYNAYAQMPELVKDIVPDATGTGSYPSSLFDYGGKLLFATHNMDTNGLWITDGTETGTRLIRDEHSGGMPYDQAPIVYGGKVIYAGVNDAEGRELWMTDGTTAGTSLISNINIATNGDPYGFTLYKGKVYFSANDGPHGYELWVTDGTATGTYMLKDISPGIDDGLPTEFTECNGLLFFSAASYSYGAELWVTDGTEAGTHMLRDINTGINSSYPQGFKAFNGKVYFQANDAGNGNQLWVSDGTTAGTQMVSKMTATGGNTAVLSLTVCNGKLYYTGADTAGFELWTTDGTQAGTYMVKDIYPGDNSGVPGTLYSCYGKLYFSASSGNTYEPWISDGTEAGTVMLKLIYPTAPSASGSNPYGFTEYNGKVYFYAIDALNGRQVWVTNGTTDSTKMVPLNTTTPPGNATGYSPLQVSGGIMYYPATYSHGIGLELYKLNTSFATHIPDNALLTDIAVYPNPAKESVTLQYNLTVAGNPQYRLYDVAGKCAGVWQDGVKNAGRQSKQLDISNLAPATYQLQIEVNGRKQSVSLTKQ